MKYKYKDFNIIIHETKRDWSESAYLFMYGNKDHSAVLDEMEAMSPEAVLKEVKSKIDKQLKDETRKTQE